MWWPSRTTLAKLKSTVSLRVSVLVASLITPRNVPVLFGTQIKYLEFFKYFWVNDVFIFMIVILMGLTGLYLMARPNDKAAEIEGKIAAVARGERRVK